MAWAGASPLCAAQAGCSTGAMLTWAGGCSGLGRRCSGRRRLQLTQQVHMRRRLCRCPGPCTTGGLLSQQVCTPPTPCRRQAKGEASRCPRGLHPSTSCFNTTAGDPLHTIVLHKHGLHRCKPFQQVFVRSQPADLHVADCSQLGQPLALGTVLYDPSHHRLALQAPSFLLPCAVVLKQMFHSRRASCPLRSTPVCLGRSLKHRSCQEELQASRTKHVCLPCRPQHCCTHLWLPKRSASWLPAPGAAPPARQQCWR